MHRLAVRRFLFSLQVLPLLSSSPVSPVYPLFRLLLPRSLGPAIFPLPRCSRLPPFSPSRTCVCARAPSDFFPVFTHRSFFPFRNIIGGAMHLSPFPSPPPLAPLASPPSLARSSRGRPCGLARSLARPASPTSANPGRVPATR